jgi:hypothetical protein
VALFRAAEFPYKWEEAEHLLEGVWAVDATMFPHEGRYWMFAGGVRKHGRINSELFLFHAQTPLGPWVAHAMNPVVSDVSRARPAGQVFSHQGVLIRPGQDCSSSYGGAIVLNRIEVLTPEEYREVPIKRLGPDWFPGSLGTHTITHSEHFQAVDARRWALRPHLILKKLWWSLRNRFNHGEV